MIPGLSLTLSDVRPCLWESISASERSQVRIHNYNFCQNNTAGFFACKKKKKTFKRKLVGDSLECDFQVLDALQMWQKSQMETLLMSKG